MPNWDADEGPGFDIDDEREHRRQRRNLYGRATPAQPRKMWNGQDVREMETDHVLNSILFCEKRFAEAKHNYATCFPEATNPFYFKSPFDMFPDYINLREEWDRRSK